MSEYYDTYFINSKRALKTAKQNNQVKVYNGQGTQICYYYGTKLKKEFPNLIHLPIDTIKKFFQKSNLRKPEYIDFIDSDYLDQDEAQENVKEIIAKIFDELTQEEKKINAKLLKKLQNLTPVQKKEKLTFAIIVSKTLKENYKFAKNLSKSLKKLNHNAILLSEEGDMKPLIYSIRTKNIYERILEIRPNSVVFINDLKTNFLPKSISQISILNSFISVLEKLNQNDIRKNDIILTSNYFIQKKLSKTNIKSEYIPPIYQKNQIKSKKLISKKEHLLIHANYVNLSQSYLILKPMIEKLEIYVKTNTLTMKHIQKELRKTKYPYEDDYELMLFIYNQLLTQVTLKNLDLKNLNIKLIGYNWEKYNLSKIKPIKPTLSKIKSMYQSSKYVLHLSSSIVDDRLLMILAAGSIPIVYDTRYKDNYYNKIFDDYCLFFKNEEELNEILKRNLVPKSNNAQNLLSYNNYYNLAVDICEKTHDRNAT